MAVHSLTLKSRSGKMFLFCTESQGQSGTVLQFASCDAASQWIRQSFDRHPSQSDSIRNVYQWFSGQLSAKDLLAPWSAVRDAELCRTLATAVLEGKLLILQQPERTAVLTAPQSVTPAPASSKTLERGGKATDKTPTTNSSVASGLAGTNAANNPTPATENVETCGDPVAMCTGEEILELTDFELAGPLPMQWIRTYRSSQSHQNIGFGYGWRSNFNLYIDTLTADDGTVALQLVNEEGRRLHFARPEPGQTSYQLAEELALRSEADGSLVLLKPDNTHWVFVPANSNAGSAKSRRWLLHQVMDSVGRHLQLYYNSQSQLSRIDYTGKKGIELHYNSAGLLSRIEAVSLSNPTEQPGKTAQTPPVVLAQYCYNDDQELISAANSAGQTEKYQYSQRLLTVRQRASGFCHYFSWQGNGPAARCIRNWGDDGIYDYRFSYDDKTRSASSIDGNGHCWQYFHNKRNLLIKKVAPDGSTWQYSWNAQGKKTAETTPDGSTTRFYYNEKGQLVTREQADGAITHFQYNELGQRNVIIDAEGRQWRREYSAAGLLLSEINPDSSVTRYQYSGNNQLERVYLPDGSTQRLLWSDESQLLALKHNDALTRYSYDSLGRLNGVVDASGLVTEYHYNPAGKLLKQVQYPADSASRADAPVLEQYFSYDESGRLLSTTNANGDIVERQYGGLSQPTSLLQADGSAFHYEYDNERNLTAIMRSDGARYQLDYDALERPVRLQGFDGRQQQFQYDVNGNVASVRDGSKRQLKVKRDKCGRIVEQTALHGQNLTSNHFHYDKIGRVLRASNGQRKLRFSYHLNGQVTEIWQDNSCIAHQYNQQGKRSSTTLPDGSLIDYRYNEEGQLTQLAVNQQPLLWRTFDCAGRETAREYQSGLLLQQQFDAFNRLTSQQWQRGEQTQQRQYSYSPLHQLQKVTDNQLGDIEYQYNKLDQLISKQHSADPSQNESHQWDSFGNPQGDGIEVKQDRLLRYHNKQYQYDDSGNQIHAVSGPAGQQREFNGLNQLTSVSCNGAISRYEYDAFGRRSAKISDGERTEYFWDGDKLIGENRAGEYSWFIYEPGSNKPLLLLKNGAVYYYQLDQLGTPLSLTDSNNNIVWQASYSVFGKATVTRNETDNPIRFQGQYFDSETGLHYNHFRYYDPETGRFISQDPIGLLGGINHYQYAPNHVNWIDPLGLSCKEGKPRYKITDLLPGYIGENDPDNCNRWNKPNVVEYLNEKQKLSFELEVSNGLLVNKISGQPFDTGESISIWGGAIFIMEADGRIYASNYQEREIFHHSSLASGSAVASAGTLQVIDGLLTEVSNKSGHYETTQNHNNQFFEELESRGMKKEFLDKVKRTGYRQDGFSMNEKTHADFRRAESWQTGEEIPDDWMDF
ncbi:RHS repeat-associated core domain-containing protein [Arsukibacterium indicum]|uniref:RHS domain-containing protein n=1 Tax=Arsukibacterium indicum TaxID=2848612 RepID=A0ABS6MLM9_9GAMM|nr:RHS repeat-associated core domain-containing protein [Arsukibacterium indicum]MBV2129706.1 RHS domain-containing protein [Arsukibacterium indicum]